MGGGSMFKKISVSLVLFFFTALCVFSNNLPHWVTSYGTHTPFNEQAVTGFGMFKINGSEAEALDAAKNQALDDLARRIRVKISSEIFTRETDTGDSYNSYISTVTKSTASLQIPNVEFLIEKDRNSVYALAYTDKADLINEFSGKIHSALLSITENIKIAEQEENSGANMSAVQRYIMCLPYFLDVYESYSLIRTVSSTEAPTVFSSLDVESITTLQKVVALEQMVKRKIDELKGLEETSLDRALEKIVFILKEQNVTSGNLQTSAITFQNTDFSSPFGQYAAQKLRQVLQSTLPYSPEKKVVQSSYWIQGDRVELLVQARLPNSGGKVIGNASAVFPLEAIPAGYAITPRNHVQALLDLMDFEEDAISDGGIHVDMWTNKGRSEDVLVFREGEELELFFRINQPCTLQITYVLATGEKVLLEERFYIGIDRVNRVVRYPYAFEVVPPFGVERLIVTAFSGTPPEPNVLPRIIQGEEYMVFDNVRAAVAETRGLKKKDTTGELRVGETQIGITTVP